jgi:ribosomal-protein-alanine N-acetyltransferase
MLQKEIITPLLILRPWQDKDAKRVIQIATKDVALHFDAIPYPYPLTSAKKWLSDLTKRNDSFEFAIVLKKTSEVIGGVAITGISNKTKKKVGSLSYWIGKDYQRQGFAFQAGLAIIDYSFKVLSLERLYARVSSNNRPSINLLEKLGFKKEGQLRNHDLNRFTDKFEDRLYFGLLKKEFNKTS